MPVQSAAEHASALASQLLATLEKTRDVPPKLVEQLSHLAIAEDPSTAAAGTRALFQQIIEPLGDRFEPSAGELYIRLFTAVLDYCRRQPTGRAFDRQLRRFSLETRQQIVDRARRVREARTFQPLSNAGIHRVRSVFVPSRVTLGADVAVTSAILSRMKALFPNATIMLIGSAKAGSLFASDPRVKLLETNYPRGGKLQDRLDAWVAASDSVTSSIGGLVPDEYLLVDPDSRLTQLGLLPLVPHDSRYYFFESRSYVASGHSGQQSLGLLTDCWLGEVFPVTQRRLQGFDYVPSKPYVALPVEDVKRGRAFRDGVSGVLAAVNLGVGGNHGKRIDDAFEAELLRSLFEAGYTLILDRGAGEEELERTNRLTESLRANGKRVAEVPTDGRRPPSADIYLWEGSLSGFGGLIAVADLYCGYDSAGGHLAAAIETPVIDIFTDAAPERLRERWTPWGGGPVTVITASRSAPADAMRQLQKVLREQRR